MESFMISPFTEIALLFINSLASLLEEAILLSTSKSIRGLSSNLLTGKSLNASSISWSVKSLILPENKQLDIFKALLYSSLPWINVITLSASFFWAYLFSGSSKCFFSISSISSFV